LSIILFSCGLSLKKGQKWHYEDIENLYTNEESCYNDSAVLYLNKLYPVGTSSKELIKDVRDDGFVCEKPTVSDSGSFFEMRVPEKNCNNWGKIIPRHPKMMRIICKKKDF
jgi:hypothetical protein